MNRYLVLTIRTPQFQPSCIEPHYAFLDELRKQGKLEMTGPLRIKPEGPISLR